MWSRQSISAIAPRFEKFEREVSNRGPIAGGDQTKKEKTETRLTKGENSHISVTLLRGRWMEKDERRGIGRSKRGRKKKVSAKGG